MLTRFRCRSRYPFASSARAEHHNRWQDSGLLLPVGQLRLQQLCLRSPVDYESNFGPHKFAWQVTIFLTHGKESKCVHCHDAWRSQIGHSLVQFLSFISMQSWISDQFEGVSTRVKQGQVVNEDLTLVLLLLFVDTHFRFYPS